MPRRVVPHVRLDKPTVVQAAADLLDAEGVDALTLSRLAEQLGVQTPSLYNHVDGLPGLQRELARLNARQLGERLAEAAIGQAGPDGVLAVAQAFRAHIRAHPGLYLATVRASGNLEAPDADLQAAERRVLDIVVAVVASLGLTGDDALHAVRGLRAVTHGFATLEIAGGFGMPLDLDESFRRLMSSLIRGLTAPRSS